MDPTFVTSASASWLSWMIVVTATQALISVVALAVARIANQSAAVRHTVLVSALATLLLAPVVSAAGHCFGIATLRLPLVDAATPRVLATGNQILMLDPLGPRPRAESRSHGALESGANRLESLAPTGPESIDRRALVPALPGRAATSDNLRGFSLTIAVALTTAIWAAGVLFCLARLGAGMARVGGIRRHAEPCGATVGSACLRVARQLHCKHPPRVFLSDRVFTPIAIGVISPAVILPARVIRQITSEQLHDVLVHEIAHLQRRDPLIALIEHLACALFWPNRLVHRLCHELDRAREEVCDNWVLATRGGIEYGETLLRLAQLSRTAPRLLTATGALYWRGKLESRIETLIDSRRIKMTHISKKAAAATFLFLASLCLLAAGSTVIASRPESANDPSASPEPSTTRSVPEVPVDEPWGDELGGLRTRLVVDDSAAAVGGPLVLRLEMRNIGDVVRRYDPQLVAPFRTLSIQNPDGEQEPYVGPPFSTSGGAQLIRPGETVVLFDQYDASEHYLLDKAGKYLIHARGAKSPRRPPPPGRDEAARLAEIPPSNTLSVELRTGRLSALKTTYVAMRDRKPAEWRVALYGRAILISTGTKSDATTVQLWFTDDKLAADFTLGSGDQAREIHYLGFTPFGHANLAAPPRARILWPDHRDWVVACLRAGVANSRPAIEAETRSFLGRWQKPQSIDPDGTVQPTISLSFRGDHLTIAVTRDGKIDTIDVRFKLVDSTSQPMRRYMTLDGPNRRYKSQFFTYKLEGDTLTIDHKWLDFGGDVGMFDLRGRWMRQPRDGGGG